MNLSDETKQFLRYYGEDYLAKDDVEGLFDYCKRSWYGSTYPNIIFELFEMFNEMKVNIFNYMSKVPDELFFAIGKNKLPNEINITGRVTRIGARAFANNKSIKKVIIGDSVELIDTQAFLGCSNLSSLHLGNSVQVIKNGAFADTNLKHVYLPESVIALGNKVFPENCYLISPRRKNKSLKFPKSELEWYREHLVLDPKLATIANETEDIVDTTVEEEN